jgi:predicted nucleotidyltransferase component of viral defense system
VTAIYLHDHKDFPDLLQIIEEETGILAGLVEKDYWIMHALYGLKKQGYNFQLKGGTSLSKGFGIIERFSEDIDLHINPPQELGINENPNNSNTKNIERKKQYYDRLAAEIDISGITEAERDTAFDDPKKYNSGGIRLYYKKVTGQIEKLKEGILLEAGYDNVAPNRPVTITSWAYEKAPAIKGIELIDNRAVDILCYDPRYTFVEKVQTIATKFRKEMETGDMQTNYMRQYYDVYSLLSRQEILDFIGTEEYLQHKERRFPATDFAIPVRENEAFLLNDAEVRNRLQKRYEQSKTLYYKGQPPFEDILSRIKLHIGKL